MSGFPHASPFASKQVVKPKRSMLDKPEVAAFSQPARDDPEKPPKPPPSVKKFSQPEVEATRLDDLDLPEELAFVHRTAKNLLKDSMHDDTIPLNQRVQAVNSLNSVVADITKMHTALYNAERYRILEQVLIETLKAYPKLKNEVLDKFEENLKISGCATN